jgi:hypothetical protein
LGTADPGSIITVYDGTTILGTTKAGADGKWSFLAKTVSNGLHKFYGKATS